jgi:ATP/maltotriose-dependent transcriptional regulator MalT
MDQAFVGRQTELAFLRTRLEAIHDGTPQTVLVAGAAGVGKTALLGEFLASSSHRIVQASGDNLELRLAYGVIEQLTSGVGEPLPQRLNELSTEDAAYLDPVQIGAGLLDLLGRLQAEGPVITVIDDAHWADRESLQALAFALRRLRADRVLAILVAREDLVEWLPTSLQRLIKGPAGARLALAGLEAAELRELSVALGTGSLSRRAACRLHDHTGGNPLHARALLEELPTTTLHHNGQPLPAPRSFRKLVLARLATCPPDTEQLVVAAAVLGSRCPLNLASRVAEIKDPLAALERAIAAHLLQEQPTATERLVIFPHPLVRAAVYHDLGPARRAGLHARAARLMEAQPDALRHRVAAASGPDPRLAADLLMLADWQAKTGAWTTAADTLLAAARLTATQLEREPLVLEAIDHLLLGGAATEATAFTEQLETFSDSPQRDYVLARLAMVAGRHIEAEQLLARAWQHNELAAAPRLAAAIAEQLALYGLLHARGDAAVAWARRALAMAPPDRAAGSNLLDILTVGLVLSGRAPTALALTATLSDPAGPAGPGGSNPPSGGPSELDGWIGRAIARGWTDDLEGARRDLAAALAIYQHRSAPMPWALIGLGFLAEIEYRLGTWDDAIAHAELAVSLTRDSDQHWLAPFVHAVAALPLAARGAREPARAHVTEAAAYLQLVGTEDSMIWVATAQALLALADNDHQQVAAALQPIRRLPRWTSVDEPGWQPWLALSAEAQTALGCDDEAEHILVPFEEFAATRGRRSTLAAAARARGSLEAARGHPEQADAAFRAGLAHVSDLSMPFDQALLETAYGRFLRHTGQRGPAAAQLEAARTRLAELDARPYLERCDRELAACGRIPSTRQPGPRATLTQQELVVARLVTAGQTNRQAAEELVLSVKTIEYHLGNAYAKLGVTSRTQLALALRQD